VLLEGLGKLKKKIFDFIGSLLEPATFRIVDSASTTTLSRAPFSVCQLLKLYDLPQSFVDEHGKMS
jgi:hypothetical protein